ncbi:uncharacterized protein LOC120281064 [Dioscorea cayenensis subsp. rotundata]|uniref:Uncharacterized protein LOC120281064 n=1 Tax=Dioscorea cayennensis subsp. rotundata TaxID=55577 RepID=A0AB40CV37_DIOCR|nr:uncharacterized protein LOC120281064 [Dioscorea cayenensis subsp. rotundata]
MDIEDVIGEVIGKDNPKVQESYGKTSKLMDVVLQDLELMSEQDCSSQRISQVSSSFAYSIFNDLSSEENNVKSIGQLAESIEVGSYWVFATIIEIESDQDWWYLSCKRCSKKVNPVGKRFYREKCDKFDFEGTPRFKVQVRVIDDTGNASFLLWDLECLQLLGKIANDLRHDSTKISMNESYLAEIDTLVERKILFKVQIKTQNIMQHYEMLPILFDSINLTEVSSKLVRFLYFIDAGEALLKEMMPTFMLVKGGKEVSRVVGAKKDELDCKIVILSREDLQNELATMNKRLEAQDNLIVDSKRTLEMLCNHIGMTPPHGTQNASNSQPEEGEDV